MKRSRSFLVGVIVALAACAPDESRPAPAPASAPAAAPGPVVTVIDSGGAPVDGATVVVESGEMATIVARGKSGADGTARLPGAITERPLVLAVVPPAKRRDLIRTVVEQWVPADTIVKCKVRATLEGVVVDTEGRPLQGVKVGRPMPGATAAWTNETTDAEGRFRFDDSDSGAEEELVLSVHGGGPDRLERKVKWRAGEARAPITFDPGPCIRVRLQGAAAADPFDNPVQLLVGGELRDMTMADGTPPRALFGGLDPNVRYGLQLGRHGPVVNGLAPGCPEVVLPPSSK